MLRVLIADDHAILRRGLCEIMLREFKAGECGEAETAEQVMAQIQSRTWDVLILDVSMPGRSGMDVIADVKRVRPNLPVLVLSMHPEDQYAKRSLRAGASGYITKDTPPDEFIRALRKVLAGGRYVSAKLAEKLAWEIQQDPAQPLHATLSNRELEVLRQMAAGNTISQIAERLHVSGTTVSTYRARILEKMQMTTSAELMSYALRNGLAD
jgi:DNA-binding NarL/FixJ family response regulator